MMFSDGEAPDCFQAVMKVRRRRLGFRRLVSSEFGNPDPLAFLQSASSAVLAAFEFILVRIRLVPP